jgi:DNA (cytosine-5)-methyltransferase 1
MQQQTINGKDNGINESSNKNPEQFNEKFYAGVKLLKCWKPQKTSIDCSIDVLDFFSGCGGMSLGFAAISQKTNLFNIIGGIDVNEVALKSFEKNYKAKTLCKDIREIYLNGEQEQIKKYFGIKTKRERPLIVIGCAPCQGFSAHRKKNWHKDDERNTLIGAFAEVVVSFEPDYIVMENVPEILGEKYFQHYQEAKEIFESKGYKISQSIFNSAGFGVPQARHRAVIVASKKTFSLPKEILMPNEYATVKDAIGDLPKVNAGEIFKGDYYHRSASHKKSTIDTISKVPKNGGSRPKGVGPKCLDKVNGFYDVYGRLSWDKPAITITQYSRNPASGRFTHPIQNRGLTIREAARIQSFPDGFEFEGTLDECFKQIGEAVPPLLSLAIATQIAIDFLSSKNEVEIKNFDRNDFPPNENHKNGHSVQKTKKTIVT